MLISSPREGFSSSQPARVYRLIRPCTTYIIRERERFCWGMTADTCFRLSGGHALRNMKSCTSTWMKRMFISRRSFPRTRKADSSGTHFWITLRCETSKLDISVLTSACINNCFAGCTRPNLAGTNKNTASSKRANNIPVLAFKTLLQIESLAIAATICGVSHIILVPQ